MRPTYSREVGNARISVFGDAVKWEPLRDDLSEPKRIIELGARAVGAQNVLWQRLPSGRTHRERGKVLPRYYIERSREFLTHSDMPRLDGVILSRSGDAVAFLTSDCPVAVFTSSHPRGPIVICHAGREAIHAAPGSPHGSAIVTALQIGLSQWGQPGEVRGLIVCGIGPDNFNNERYPELVAAMTKEWGSTVVRDPRPERLTIDLKELIVRQAESLGIDRTRIETDDIDTYSDVRFASKRANRGGHNLVVVTYTQA
jgi:copper oxidase (laccase) domain-containing protein